jgi:hypothetical protein
MTGIVVAGCGNAFFNPSVANCAKGIIFGPSVENNVHGCSVENCEVGVAFATPAAGNGVIGIQEKSVAQLIDDAGKDNWVVSNDGARFPLGIRFGRANADPRVLDYYQEGDWTPTLVGGREAGAYVLATRSAKFVRIGRQITLSACIGVEVSSPGAGVARFGGLPYPKAAGTTMVGTALTTRTSWPAEIVAVAALPWTEGLDATFHLAGQRNGVSPYKLEVTDLQSGSEIEFSATYFTSV